MGGWRRRRGWLVPVGAALAVAAMIGGAHTAFRVTGGPELPPDGSERAARVAVRHPMERPSPRPMTASEGRVTGYRADGRTLIIEYVVRPEGCASILVALDVEQYADLVRVGLIRVPSAGEVGSCPGQQPYTAESRVLLAEPLGDRSVVDAHDRLVPASGG